MVRLVFAFLVATGGPPALPPLPGEQPPPEDEPVRPSPDAGSKPKAAPAPKKAAPAPKKAAPAPKSEPAPEDPPQPQPSEGTSWSIPQLDEPPQPDTAPPPPTEGASPPRESEAPTMAPEIPGEETQATMLRLPPPDRPFYGGTGLMIGAGVTFAVALTEQIVAHTLVKRRCIDPIGRGVIEDTADFGEIFYQCAPGVLPALALRVHSDLALLATIGLAAGGAALRGQRDAWDDVFTTPKQRKHMAGLRYGGIALIGTGIVTWFSTGAGAWGLLGSCRTARCANASRAMAFSTRHVSAVLVAAGAGMLAYAEAHRRHSSRFRREKLMTVQPMVSWGFTGVSLTGSF